MADSGRNEMDIAWELTSLALKNETNLSRDQIIWDYLVAYANVANATRNYPDSSKLIPTDPSAT